MFSSVVAVFGRPERSSSPKHLQPRLNSAARNFTVVNDEVGKPIDENSACVEVGKPIDENPACVEVGTNSV
ncbi:hypothetical protein TNCV_4846221 [Trichonephila clavipes]|uniref:Uncharacterized protein n=1 Tax=Trichonephila clavipes TaxID=2585209 RepID=A0A8X6WK62_TRICX|nr:hypothetical protein TNCV_4846221 [Trichonephila clavipes]